MTMSVSQKIDQAIEEIQGLSSNAEIRIAETYELALRAYVSRKEKQYLVKLNQQLFSIKVGNIAKRAFTAVQWISSTNFDVDAERYSNKEYTIFYSKKGGILEGINFNHSSFKENYEELVTKHGKDCVIYELMQMGKEKPIGKDPVLKAINFLKELDSSFRKSQMMSENDLPKEDRKNIKKLECFAKATGITFKQFSKAMEEINSLPIK